LTQPNDSLIFFNNVSPRTGDRILRKNLLTKKKSKIHEVKYHTQKNKKKTLLTDTIYITAEYAIIRRFNRINKNRLNLLNSRFFYNHYVSSRAYAKI
jgi:hypothetical protein